MAADCAGCGGGRLDLGGWMGPTPEAPYPRTCPECSPDASPRELQTAYAAYLHAMDPGHHLERRLRILGEGRKR